MNMEGFSEFLTAANAAIAVVAGAFTSGFNWVMNKVQWWRSLESTPLKMVVAAGVFVAFCLLLSILTAPFT